MDEILCATEMTGDIVIGEVAFNNRVSEQTLGNITVSQVHPLLFSVSMVAPSPDWFTGFYDFDACTTSGRSWLSKFMILTYPFDAGIEQGVNSVSVTTQRLHTDELFSLPTKPSQPTVSFSMPLEREYCQWQSMIVGW